MRLPKLSAEPISPHTESILRRLSRRLRTIRPTPPAARAAPIPTTRAVTAGTWKWHVLWFFGRWSTGPGLRSIPLPESVDVGLRLPKKGGPTAYANSVSAVSIITVVTVDDVLFPFDKGEPAAAAGWWCGDVHVLVDSALPHSADLEANRGAVLRGDRRCLGIIGVLDRDCSPRENCRKLLQLFGRSPRLRTLTRVDLPGVPKEPEDNHHEREAQYGYSYGRGPNPLPLCNHWPHDLFRFSWLTLLHASIE